MSQHDDRGNAPRFFELFGDWMTGGMFGLVKWIYALIVDSCTMLLMVIIRKNMGYKIAKHSELIFTSFLIFVLISFSAFGTTANDSTSSYGLIWYHWIGFIFFANWRKLGAWMSLRKMYPKMIRSRISNSIGESVIYPFLRFILKPIGLIDLEDAPKTSWKLTHDRWLQFWEPLLFGILGFVIMRSGYEVYGQLIIVSAVCVGKATFRAYDNTAKVGQAEIDAKNMGDILSPMEEKEKSKPHVIE